MPQTSNRRTSLVVQWLRLHTSNAGCQDSIPGQGTRSHMPQLRLSIAKQTNKYLNKQTKNLKARNEKIPEVFALKLCPPLGFSGACSRGSEFFLPLFQGLWLLWSLNPLMHRKRSKQNDLCTEAPERHKDSKGNQVTEACRTSWAKANGGEATGRGTLHVKAKEMLGKQELPY